MASDGERSQNHAGAMDQQYRLQRHLYDVTRKYYLLGRDRLIAELNPEDGGTVLEMGCGTGRNLVAVAKRFPQARIYGFDISNEMLKSSEAALKKAGVEARVSLAQGDATNFDAEAAFSIPSFDRVYFSYTLSMVPDWKAAMAEGVRLTAPQGCFSAVDFGTCAKLPGFFKKGLYAWLNTFHVTPREDIDDIAAGIASHAGRALQFQSLYGGYASYLRIE